MLQKPAIHFITEHFNAVSQHPELSHTGSCLHTIIKTSHKKT